MGNRSAGRATKWLPGIVAEGPVVSVGCDLLTSCAGAQVGGGPLREDLSLSNVRELNAAVDELERYGLPIMRDDQGRIRYRGMWDISIHGEQLKPIMAEKAIEYRNRLK